jgi:large subunit ribosomal protein L18
MARSKNIGDARLRRHARVRRRVSGTPDRPRMTVFRSLKNIYVQIVDDTTGKTICAASSLSKDMMEGQPKRTKTDLSKAVGRLVAEKALKNGVKKIVFDKGGYRYHGRIKALADAAREAGLEF